MITRGDLVFNLHADIISAQHTTQEEDWGERPLLLSSMQFGVHRRAGHGRSASDNFRRPAVGRRQGNPERDQWKSVRSAFISGKVLRLAARTQKARIISDPSLLI